MLINEKQMNKTTKEKAKQNEENLQISMSKRFYLFYCEAKSALSRLLWLGQKYKRISGIYVNIFDLYYMSIIFDPF